MDVELEEKLDAVRSPNLRISRKCRTCSFIEKAKHYCSVRGDNTINLRRDGCEIYHLTPEERAKLPAEVERKLQAYIESLR